MEYHLNIKILSKDPKIIEYYKNMTVSEDSGIDLLVPQDGMVSLFNTYTIDHLIQTQMSKVDTKTGEVQPVGYWLLPRSSISKTNLRMANSVGLIDSGYRGNIMAKIDMKPKFIIETHKVTVADFKEEVKQYTRLFQIAAPDLTPISKITIVSTMDQTERGSGGFGSTGC